MGVVPGDRVPHRVGNRGPQRARVVGLVDRRGDHLTAPGLHHHPAIGLLFIRRPHHVDLALHVEEGARVAEGATPLPGAGLGGEPFDALGLVVEGLGYCGVGLVGSRRGDRLVLEVDPGRRVQRLLQPPGPDERRRAPHPQDVENLAGDVGRHLLADQRHREQGREQVRGHRLAGPRVQRRLQWLRQMRDYVVPGLGYSIG